MQAFIGAVVLVLLWSPSLAEDLVTQSAEIAQPVVQIVNQQADDADYKQHGNLRHRRQCSPSASITKATFGAGEQVEVIINICQNFAQEWFGIWPAGTSPVSGAPAVNWQLTCGGQTCQNPQNVGGYRFGLNQHTVSQGSSTWPLPGGSYVIYYHSAFGSFPTATFSIVGGTSPSVPAAPIPNTQNAVQRLNRPIRVACAGDSLTWGRSRVGPGDDYPTQLARLLDGNFELYNFGRNAMVASMGTDVSYDRTGQFGGSLGIEPDIYLLMIGTNDVRQGTAGVGAGITNMVQLAKNAGPIDNPRGTRVILATPPWVQGTCCGINNAGLVSEVIPQVRSVAASQQVQLLDVYSVTVNQPSYYAYDGLHPNRQGYGAIAAAWQAAIQCNQNGICEVGETCSSCPSDCFVNC